MPGLLINDLLWEVLKQNLTTTEQQWLNEKSLAQPRELMTAFVAAPRILSKRVVDMDVAHSLEISKLLPGFSIEGWTVVRLGRVWLLTCLDASGKEEYTRYIDTLFDTAEMNELVALYSALPLLEYPEQWLFRATDAVRSNMGVVLDAIALHNPYPSRHFTDPAWNQLVLKVIFNDKPIHYIVGLDERANEPLARTLSDFAHERWAAGRKVAPQVWRLVSKFMDDALLKDMEHLFRSSQPYDRESAALACHHAHYEPAHQLLASHPDLEKAVQHGTLTWAQLEFTDLNTYV
ncbi:EboA domain-containing protein [Telluribacter humicola]|uniref:EboA domain-containing protein n=1 Tax=Telluribacter humicola TaxID=1720261 RepID=UPI001A967C54|nr:EboA domain-containing protein [Telluribacter humicola]